MPHEPVDSKRLIALVRQLTEHIAKETPKEHLDVREVKRLKSLGLPHSGDAVNLVCQGEIMLIQLEHGGVR